MLIDLANSIFYLQGNNLTVNITPPKDKTLESAAEFKYVYTLEYSFIQESNQSYYYNDTLSTFLNKQLVTVTNNTAQIPIPNIQYDAAFKLTFFVRDDKDGTTYPTNGLSLIFYAFHTENRKVEITQAEWDQVNDKDVLNITASQELIGPVISEGTITAEYWVKYLNLLDHEYTSSFYLSTLSNNSNASFGINVSINNSRVLIQEDNFDNTTQQLVFSPNTSGTVVSNANVAATLDTSKNKLKIIYTITGLQKIYYTGEGELTPSAKDLHNYERCYLTINTSLDDSQDTIVEASTIIQAILPLVQFKNQSVLINSKKNTEKTASLIINNPTTDTGYYDINLVSAINTEPSGIAFTDNTGETYAILKISKTEAEAWYDLIGHA